MIDLKQLVLKLCCNNFNTEKVGEQYIITYISKEMCDLLQMPMEEIINHPLTDHDLIKKVFNIINKTA